MINNNNNNTNNQHIKATSGFPSISLQANPRKTDEPPTLLFYPRVGSSFRGLWSEEKELSTLHLAAASGQVETVQCFLQEARGGGIAI